MRRKIKFRGKTLEQHGMLPAGSWVFGGYYMDDCYGGCPKGKHYILSWNSGGPGGYMDRIEVDLESLGQYTGIKDKNGVEIYERDILRVNVAGFEDVFGDRDIPPTVEIQDVEFRDGCFQCDTIPLYVFNDCDGDDAFYKCEVIGNISDHPHLLT